LKHENITELYAYTQNEKEVALYLEEANKASYLTELIHDDHTPVEDEAQLKSFAKDILEALAYIHSQGIIHGDVKLPNML
jgi:serine/threonine protein kinase